MGVRGEGKGERRSERKGGEQQCDWQTEAEASGSYWNFITFMSLELGLSSFSG